MQRVSPSDTVNRKAIVVVNCEVAGVIEALIDAFGEVVVLYYLTIGCSYAHLDVGNDELSSDNKFVIPDTVKYDQYTQDVIEYTSKNYNSLSILDSLCYDAFGEYITDMVDEERSTRDVVEDIFIDGIIEICDVLCYELGELIEYCGINIVNIIIKSNNDVYIIYEEN